MKALRRVRWTLLLFVGLYLVGVGLSSVTSDDRLLGALFWLCVLSVAGAAAASIAALAIQLSSLFRRRPGNRVHHG